MKEYRLVNLRTVIIIGIIFVKDNRGQTGGPPGYDTNVVPVWRQGITGEGVVVCILDDGLDHTHEDIKQNYVSVKISYYYKIHRSSAVGRSKCISV